MNLYWHKVGPDWELTNCDVFSFHRASIATITRREPGAKPRWLAEINRDAVTSILAPVGDNPFEGASAWVCVRTPLAGRCWVARQLAKKCWTEFSIADPALAHQATVAEKPQEAI